MPTFPRNIFELGQMFGDDQSCQEFMFQVRWPKGFQCPKCEHIGWNWVKGRNHIIQCNKCRLQISLTSGTAMEKSHISLCEWFVAAYIQTTAPEMSTNAIKKILKRKRYEPVWVMRNKIKQHLGTKSGKNWRTFKACLGLR